MADRSLSFFVTIANQQNNPDSKTGMSTSTKDVQYNVQKYDKNNPLGGSTTETQSVKYNLVGSLQNDDQTINYQGNSKTNNFTPYTSNPEHESDIKLSSIIDWTHKSQPSMKLNVFNFAYLKDFNVYPANRLMVLRRYNDGVPHDLFNCSTKPINTMVSYYGLDASPFNISFKERWTEFESSIMELLQDVIGIKFDSIPSIGKIVSAASSVVPSNLQQTVLEAIGQKLGLISNGGAIYGDPNMIYQAAIRDASGEDMSKTGLESTFSATFKTTYVFREINGIDAKAAMLDIIANAVHMGTSNGRFILTHNASDKLSKIVNAMQTGDIDGMLNEVIDAISDVVAKSSELLSDIASNIKSALTSAAQGDTAPIVDDILSVAGQLIRNRFSRYKWQLRGAIGALSGQHTAPWHLTFGNPKFPWFTIGNLVVDGVDLNFGGELSYNDTPTEVTVTIKLKSGRVMGAGELTSLFNNGKGRIYDTPESVQVLKVPQDQQLSFPESPSTNRDDSQSAVNSLVTSDPANDVPATTEYSLNNQDSDNNLPSTKDDSNAGNTYKVVINGTKKHVVVTDSSGATIYTGSESYTASENALINDAKIAVGDT